MCGDSGSAEDLDRLLDGATIDLVNMDPPYNVKVEPRSNNAIAAGLSSFQRRRSTAQRHHQARASHHQSFDLTAIPRRPRRTHKKMRAKDRPLENDFVSDEAFDEMLLAWFGNASRVLKPGGSFYIWGGYANLGNYPAPLKKSGLYFSQGIVWDKQHPVLTRKDFMGAFEIGFYGWKEGAGHHFYGPEQRHRPLARQEGQPAGDGPPDREARRAGRPRDPVLVASRARTSWTCSAAAARR